MKKLYTLCLLAMPLLLLSQQRVLGPYLQNAGPTSMVVMWETSGPTPSRVSYGLTEALGNESTGGSQVGFLFSRIHTVRLEDLTPSTEYFYSVNFGNTYSDTFSFVTPPLPGSEQSFNMVAFSDMQRDLSRPDKFREIVEEGVINYSDEAAEGNLPERLAYVLVPGDLVAVGLLYPSWKDEFFEPGRRLFSMVPVYPVLGNHEANTVFFYNYFNLPDNGTGGFLEHWWYKDYSNTRIIGLESNVEYITANGGLQKQLDWLDEILTDACGNEYIDFVFAQLHHPFESELWPDGNTDYVGDAIQRLEDFSSTCGKPSILFFGHTHGYSRGQSRDHQHLLVNVASAGGNLDFWGEYGNQTDYDEFSVSQDDYGFVYMEVIAGEAPKFTLKRISRGQPGNILDNEVRDSIVVFRDGEHPGRPMAISPVEQVVGPQCVLLEADLFQSPFPGALHGASQWQVFRACDELADPVVDIWKQHENWYFNEDTQAGDDLTDQEIKGLSPNTAYCWRVRYRDRNLRWGEWSEPVPFTTSASYNVLLNPGAEYATEGWTEVSGNLESLTSGECDSRPAYEGNRFFCVGAACDPSPYGEAYQVVDVSAWAQSIDSGGHEVYFGGYLADYNGLDKPEIRLAFLDADGSLIGQTQKYGGTHANWRAYNESAVLPHGTRQLRYEIFGTRGVIGVANDSYLDALYLVVDSTAGQIDTTICAGGSVTIYGQTFTETGVYTVSEVLDDDCVNEYQVAVSVVDTAYIVISDLICEGDSVLYGEVWLDEPGAYLIIDTMSSACPVVYQVALDFLPMDSEFCLVSSTGEHEGQPVKFYPNPFSTSATIELSRMPADEFDICLYDGSGSVVRKLKNITAPQISISRSGLAAGNYFYRVTAGGNVAARGSFIIID
jgi:hypothetical protein